MNSKYAHIFFLIFLFLNLSSQIQTIEGRIVACAPAKFKFYTVGNTHSGQNWTSGAGEFSNADTPSFSYPNDGSYTITRGSLMLTIDVFSQLNYQFTADTPRKGCIPFVLTNLKDQTTYPPGIFPVSWQWIYGDGGSAYGNPILKDTIPFFNFGDCFVQMLVKTNDSACSDTAFVPNFFNIIDQPIANFSVNPTSSCKAPALISINNLSSTQPSSSYQWNWDSPSGSSTNPYPNPILFNTIGLKSIRLKVTNANQCKAFNTILVPVDSMKFDFNLPDSFCRKDTFFNIMYSNHISGQHSYNIIGFPPFVPIYFPSENSVWAINLDYPSGNYPVTIQKTNISDPTCQSTKTKFYYLVNDKPKFNYKPYSKCTFKIYDTFVLRNITKTVNEIIVSIYRRDKYNNLIDSVQYSLPNPQLDSILIDSIRFFSDIDSYYRMGPFSQDIILKYTHFNSNCSVFDTTRSHLVQSMFHSYLVANDLKGCLPFKDTFKVHTYGSHKIDSIHWIFGDGNILKTKDSTKAIHTYTSANKFLAYAIVKDKKGCVDTTNSILISTASPITPILNISNKNICVQEKITLTLSNSSTYDRWFFINNINQSLNCPQEASFTDLNFRKIGKNYVYVIAEKNGCINIIKDSIQVSGPQFYLDYNFNCSRKDSVLFEIKDTLGLDNYNFTWNYGDGSPSRFISKDTTWHKFKSRGDFWVRVSVSNNLAPSCVYTDSVLIKIRNVKAQFYNTVFCKQFLSSSTGLDYLLNRPDSSIDAGYPYQYDPHTFTWQFDRNGVKYPYITTGSSVFVKIPFDTMHLTLTARDINGCEDSIRKIIRLESTKVDFKLNHEVFCWPKHSLDFDTLKMYSLSKSFYGIKSHTWRVYRLNEDGTQIPNEIFLKHIDSNIGHTFFVFNARTINIKKYRVELYVEDSANCYTPPITKDFFIYKDSLVSNCPNFNCIKCLSQSEQLKTSPNNLTTSSYRWIINNQNIPIPDTFHKLKYLFPTIGTYEVLLVKTHRTYGDTSFGVYGKCSDTAYFNIEIRNKPRIRIDNSFDLTNSKCSPASTTISYFDSANIGSALSFKFIANQGNPAQLNPTNFPLKSGINQIQAIFQTSYGCLDSFINYDTVINPTAVLKPNNSTFCKGDQLSFILDSVSSDVDSIDWTFGDGFSTSTKIWNVFHQFNSLNPSSDSIQITAIYHDQAKLCSETDQIYIRVLGSNPNFLVEDSVCFRPVNILNTSNKKGDHYQWKINEIYLDTFSRYSSSLYSFLSPGKKRITLYSYRNPNQCVDSISKEIELYPIPKLTANSGILCWGDTAKISFKDTLNLSKIYLYPDSSYFKNPQISSPILLKLKDTQLFKLISISPYGCKDSTEVQPQIIFPFNMPSLDTTVMMGAAVQIPIDFQSLWTYVWSSNLLNPSCTFCSNPIINPIDSVIYFLTISDNYGCFSDSNYYRIRLFPDIKVVVPTAFTPNGDGVNDIIYARGFGIKKLLTFKIFNRQGQLLFVSNDELNGWDGLYKGVLQNSDPYFYTYEAESFIPGKFVTGEGNFMLLK